MGVSIGRVLDKLDSLLAQKQFDAAERHLAFWLAEAQQLGDARSELTLTNEQIGFYRKQGREAEAIAAANAAIALGEKAGLSDSVTMGTTFLNAATAFNAFDHPAEALALYRKAEPIYEAFLSAEDARRGGLYNNMALAELALGQYDAAEQHFRKALSVMEQQPGGQCDMAITYCNLADLAAAQLGQEAGETKIGALLETAIQLLNDEALQRDSYYAYVCEKCAPTFGFYGFFLDEAELKKRAEAYYERT